MIVVVIFSLTTLVLSQQGYDDYSKRIEEAVNQGKITREQANDRYRGLEERLRNSGKRGPRSNDLSIRFERLGINNLDKIKNNLKNEGVTSLQMESVLGGLLRIIYAVKETNNGPFIFDSRIERYFQNDCGLSYTQIDYIKNLLIELAK